MLIVQGLALNQLFSPFNLWPPKVNLPENLDDPDEPLEYEINLDPGPMGPKPVIAPSESAPNVVENTAVVQRPRPATANSAPSAAQPSPAQPSPAQPSPAQPSPAQPSPAQPNSVVPNPVTPTPIQSAAAVVSIAHSTPAPQPLLALEATPAPSAPDIVLVPSVDVAAASTTELAAEERGAPNGAPTNSTAVSTPVRPLAFTTNAAPDRIAAAPISILPGVQAPKIEPIIAANPVVQADRAIDRVPLDLTVSQDRPVLTQIAVPLPAVALARPVTTPIRVPPDLPKPDLRVDASAAKPNIATPAAPVAAAISPVLTRTPAKMSASESVRLEVARDEIGRPTMAVLGPIAAPDLQIPDSQIPDSQTSDRATSPIASPNSVAPDMAESNKPSEASSVDRPAAQSTDGQNSGANMPASNTSNSASSSMPNSATLAGSDRATGLPADPFARAGSGRGPRDLLGQGIDAAAAQVGANAANSASRGSAFRRYSDPFADDAPSPLAGLRLREPQMFSDVSRFLVNTFGAAALGFAVGASSEINDFSGPNAGVLIEAWIQQHHSDLQRECRMRQETMDEHIRRLLCGEP